MTNAPTENLIFIPVTEKTTRLGPIGKKILTQKCSIGDKNILYSNMRES